MDALVSTLLTSGRAAAVRRALQGFALPFRAARFLLRHRRLWPWVLAPALINIVLFAGLSYLFVTNSDWATGTLWEAPQGTTAWGWLAQGVWYVLYAVITVLSLVAAYIATLMLGGIVASPFNDVLSERAERLLTHSGTARAVDEPLWRGMLRSLGSTLVVTVCYALVLLPILALNLIPGAGSLAATVLGVSVGACFVALEYTDVALARYGFSLRQKVRLLRANLPVAGGFGLGTSLLLYLPILNVFCIPVAVVAGTALALALTHEDPAPLRDT